MANNITTFESKQIRSIQHNGEIYFSVIDVIEILTDSTAPSKYWTAIKTRENQLSTICRKFKFLAPDGKQRPTDCANVQDMFRIIMSVPSPKAEPLKMWLAQTGAERIQEIENPEQGYERIKESYRAKGYDEVWITHRLQTIETRNKLTDEWKERDVQGTDYAKLTSTIAKGTFDVTPSQHKEIKGLTKPNQNLRDHMTPLELILTSLGEEVTRKVAINQDAKGYNENLDAAIKGGETAGKARKDVEQTTGEKVVSNENFLNLITKPKQEPPKSI